MKTVQDKLAQLLPAEIIAHAERTSMPYLGYHLLRQTICTQLLGESEAPILHWMGKEIGRKIRIESAHGLLFPFIRLGLGKLDLMEETANRYSYRLTHPMFDHLPAERLGKSLSLECGILAGAISRWREREATVHLEIHQTEGGAKLEARISVQL
jgi:hypothetical protein